MRLNLTADEVLTTTRSVRRRLDFDKPVERAVVLEALDIALQALTASNSQIWQWVIIDDPAKTAAIGEIYKSNFDTYSSGPSQVGRRRRPRAASRSPACGRRRATSQRTSPGSR